MLKKFVYISFFILTISLFADDEVSLFSSQGEAVAYIDISDELTIYLWDGTPVAYLDEDISGGYNVYGFNGTHLGWFVNGVIRDHRGDASCAVKEVMKTTKFEPFKSFKSFKPFKSFKSFAPMRPFFSNSFGQISCKFLLMTGSR